ncbi:MAG: DNA repair protein RecN [Bacillota bacterium]
MLRHLEVKQFAIIEDLEVDFEPGMNVLTGETGAGKSLLIDAIGLLLGDRANKESVRSGAKKATVRALFSPLSSPVKTVLDTLEIPYEDEELLIERRISPTSGNLVKINRETVTLQDLKEVTQYLADIHTQHDTKRLINPDTYQDLLDGYDKAIQSLKHDYKENRTLYLDALEAYETLKNEKDKTLETMDMLNFQLEELENYALVKDEEETIEERLTTLQNFDKIFGALKETYAALDESNALETIYDGARTLSNVEDYNEDYKDYRSRIESAYYDLDDIRQSLFDAINGMDFDPDELEKLETRQYELDQLKRKYHRSINELIDYKEEIRERLDTFGDFDQALEEKTTKVKDTHKALSEAAKALTEKRKKTAKTIEKALEKELSDLELPNANFKIVFSVANTKDPFDRTPFKNDGTDSVDFHLSTNKGEPLKPLKNVASGGELSRIMLALKTLLLMQDALDLIIFDEIDTGVSGYVASQVAKKMAAISESVQVLAITHLPQVAAKSDYHYYIYKKTNNERTTTFIDTLDHEGRIQALAQMISSDKVSESAIKSAKELLK